ncbi:hypothetical protein J2X46_001968 [Nocardioides sp. BE266]|uniref:hypothetical protein n=1 Tax=Nocardioides sp. BE266 TaxID=2817725 RepID=UPI002862D127|nr:hypothetical protein [Nocardioides sp. BE266]MDR7252983.1 hypothetical protein [Nocardioides sp. BE266]
MDGLGTELPQRTTIMWILLAAAVVFLVPTVRTVRRATGESGGTAAGFWGMAVVMLLVLVLLPAWIARSMHERHTYLSDEGVTVTSGDDVRQQIAFADLEEVKVRFGPRGGETFRNEQVFLVGRLASGDRGSVVVSRASVETLQPLLERLSAEVERRPELLTSDVERGFFEHAVKTSP